MAIDTRVLTDLAAGTYESSLNASWGLADGPVSVTKRTLRGGASDGVDVVHVDNGKFSFAVVPTRGMGLWKAWLGDLEIGWKSPVRGPVHPQFVPLAEPSGLGWLDGFDELMVRCGLESNGAPDFDESGRLAYPLHGRIANKPAHRVEVSVDEVAGEITLTGVVEETRFHFSKLRMTTTYKTKIGEPGVRIQDQVQNFGGTPAGMQMLYHTNFGLPLVDPGARVVAPVKKLVPRNDHAAAGLENWNDYPAESAGFEEQVYFLELAGPEDGQSQVLLKNAHGTQGASLRFNRKKLPCFTIWKNPVAARDGYVTGLEPGTNFPNPRSYEQQQQRVVQLPPAGKLTFDLQLEVHDDEASVARSEAQIAALAGDIEPEIYDKPQPGWCADA